MQIRKSFALALTFAAALCLVSVGGARQASAAADEILVGTISEDDGFPGVCAAPCFEVDKVNEVWYPGNPDRPAGTSCLASDNIYTYTLTNIGGTLPSPGINVTEFEVAVDDALVTSAGFIASGPGEADGVSPVQPAIVSPLDVVNWQFSQSTSCPDCLDEGKTSDVLYICSPAASGTSLDNVSVTAIILDAPGTCLVPTQPPVVGEPNPCTIGFWKNRYAEKNGLISFFPGTDFGEVVAAALVLSGGVFTSADGANCPNFDDLLCALSSKGNRTTAERGRQQLAATLLNLAAGDLFSDNGKCVLFEENWVTSNACGDNLSVGTAVGNAKTGVTSGDTLAEHEALECLDDLNNEIGVIQYQP
jgi:hypothetical protein